MPSSCTTHWRKSRSAEEMRFTHPSDCDGMSPALTNYQTIYKM